MKLNLSKGTTQYDKLFNINLDRLNDIFEGIQIVLDKDFFSDTPRCEATLYNELASIANSREELALIFLKAGIFFEMEAAQYRNEEGFPYECDECRAEREAMEDDIDDLENLL